ncbi:MAG: HAMP domain-containing sensor histidine kinase [Bacillota bacterium]|nr:HAMP domain-containing sensor histidine kinase [Bacillota bacterium]
MNKLKFGMMPSRLGLKILLYFLVAAVFAVSSYLIMDYSSNDLIFSRLSDSENIKSQTMLELEDFRSYITENQLSTGDTDAINRWIYTEKYVFMNIYKDDYLVYSFSNPDFTTISYKYKYRADEYMPLYHRLYNVDFKDGTAQVGIYLLAASKYYDVARLAQLALAFTCFIIIFLLLISRKFKYINKLQNELKIMESGDLDHSITIRGNDEISFLAHNMEMMRISFLERIKDEKEARRANSELITSISHDLRTPLTILIGNLDVIANKKYKTEEQLNRYIENSRKKAYQLKELSDKLFEYFLVFGSEYEEPELELIDCRKLLAGLIGEYSLSLEDQGREVIVSDDIPSCDIKVNLIAVRRVFDNLFSNILKYADPGSPVYILFDKKDNYLSITIKNTIKEEPSKVESTNIGLTTCEKIMAQHKGTFSAIKNGNEFSVTISFPYQASN